MPEIVDKVLKRTHHLSSKIDNLNAKLAERYDGSFTVTKRITGVIFDLRDERGNTIRHAHTKDLKPYRSESRDASTSQGLE